MNERGQQLDGQLNPHFPADIILLLLPLLLAYYNERPDLPHYDLNTSMYSVYVNIIHETRDLN